MRKILIIAGILGICYSGASAQTYFNQSGTKVVLAGNGTDLTNTLTLTSSALGAPKTYTFPTPSLGLMHSTALGALSLSAVDLASADVTGILLGANGGTGVNNGKQKIIIYSWREILFT